VTPEEFRAWQAWKKSHPVARIEFDQDNDVYFCEPGDDLGGVPNCQVMLPKTLKIEARKFILMRTFPGSSEFVIRGGMAVVAAYQSLDDSNKRIIVKTSIVGEGTRHGTAMEQDAFQILDYLLQTRRMNGEDHQIQCSDMFIRMTAAGTRQFHLGNKLQSQSFIAIEQMDCDLEVLQEKHPDLFMRADVLRAITIKILQSLVCMHGSHPPIFHGDLKPSNILCSPLSASWKLAGLLSAVTDSIMIKVADFDASFLNVWNIGTEPWNIMTQDFASPERVAARLGMTPMLGVDAKYAQAQASEPDDIWALGISLWMLTDPARCDEFINGMSVTTSYHTGLSFRNQLLNQSAAMWTQTWNAEFAADIPLFASLIAACLQTPENRPSASKLLAHDFNKRQEEKVDIQTAAAACVIC
jgi:serine/threonine protein kinase